MSYTASYIVNSSSAQSTTDFQFTFPYIKEEHIEVFLNFSKITQGSGSAQYQVITNVSPKLIRLNTGIASANLRVEVRRNSSLGSPLVDYADGSTLTANDLDTSALQSLYIDQELKDNQERVVVIDETTGLPELNSQRLTNVTDPTAAQDAATKNYVDTKVFTSAQIQDGTLVNADINTSAAIDGTKISPNFGSQNIATTGTVDGRDVSVDGAKLDGIETGATADQTNAEIRTAVEAASDSNVFTDADHSKLNAIEASATADQTNAEIRTAVEAASDSNVFTDADHSKLNAIEANATADQTNTEIRAAVEAATDSNVFTDADHSKLNAIEASATADQTASEIKTLLQSDKLTSSEIATGALDGRYYTETESDARYFNISSGDTIKDGDAFPDNDTTIATTAAINDRIIDLVDDVGGFVPIVNETSFPTANPDVNNGTGTLVSIKEFAASHTPSGGSVTIANGAGSGNTVTITGCGSTVLAAGFGGIVETTSTLHTYTFHRLSPKATEVTTVASNISNVNAVANNSTNINSAVSNASNITTVAGANSNITTVAGSISNVNTVATNISDVSNFADLYQISTSAPTTDGGSNALAVGDLWFDSSSNKQLKVHNGSAFQAVAPTQSVLNDISIVSGQITFTEDLGSIADALSTGTGNNINTVASGIANVNTVAGISSNVTTVAGISSNVTTVAGAVSNINTTVSNLSSINNFAEVYRIASSAPSSSLNEGDLWYDATSNVLKYYNGTTWTVTAAAGLSNVVEDTSPELGGHLDCNDKNLTEVGTISGNNLQVDFGTLS